MENLKKNLNAYRLSIDRAEFYQNLNKYEDALEFYKKALNNLFYSKELIDYSDELKNTAKENKEFKEWLINKRQSILRQLNGLTKYIKNLESSIDFAKNPQNKKQRVKNHVVSPKKKRTKNDDTWENLANDSIKLLCSLRSKFDFKQKNRTFEKILHRQNNLQK
jgi:tetratricopeptide (TPR) repeat protein